MKVLSNSGGGSESRIIAAMDAVADVVKRKRVKGPTIVSMSLGGPCADKRVTRSGAVPRLVVWRALTLVSRNGAALC